MPQPPVVVAVHPEEGATLLGVVSSVRLCTEDTVVKPAFICHCFNSWLPELDRSFYRVSVSLQGIQYKMMLNKSVSEAIKPFSLFAWSEYMNIIA